MNDSLTPAMALALSATFGSVAAWAEQALALGRDGPVRLAFEAGTGALTLGLAGIGPAGIPLLNLDASALAAPTAEALLAGIDWTPAYATYQAAVHEASEAFGADADTLGGAALIDVRRAGVYAQAATRIAGADWRDPAHVATWAHEWPAGAPLVVYCVYGHEVGRSTALRLRAAGLDARYLRGGIDAWQTAGRALEPKGVLA